MNLNKKEITLFLTALITFFSVLVGLVLANYLLIALVIPCIIATYKTLEAITINKEVELFYTKYSDIITNNYNDTIFDMKNRQEILSDLLYASKTFDEKMFDSVEFSTIEEGEEIKFHISEKAAKKIFEQLNHFYPISEKKTITKEDVDKIPSKIKLENTMKNIEHTKLIKKGLDPFSAKVSFVDRVRNLNRSSYRQRGAVVQGIS